MGDEEKTQPDAKTLLVEGLWNDPQGRLAIMRETKRLHPRTPIPELEMHDMAAQLSGTLERATASEKRIAEREQREAWNSEWDETVRAGLARPDEREAITAVMKRDTIGSYAGAARAYRWEQRAHEVAHPRSGPSAMLMPGLHTPDDKHFAGLVEDRDAWARKEAYAAFDDIQRQRQGVA